MVGGCFLPIHWHLEFIARRAFSSTTPPFLPPPFFPSLLLSVGCVNPLSNGSSTGSRGCVVRAAQPSAFGKLAFFTHAFREGRGGGGGGGSCWRGCSGGRLIAHSCVEGVRWAPEVLDKVQGLVYTRTCSKGLHMQDTRWTFTQWRQAV